VWAIHNDCADNDDEIPLPREKKKTITTHAHVTRDPKASQHTQEQTHTHTHSHALARTHIKIRNLRRNSWFTRLPSLSPIIFLARSFFTQHQQTAIPSAPLPTHRQSSFSAVLSS